jgi:hypothetical protein
MSIFTAVRGIGQAESSITDVISTKCYILSAPSGTALPYTIMDAVMIDNAYNKQKENSVKTYSVKMFHYQTTQDLAITLGALWEAALEGYSGTINSVEIQGAYLDSEEPDEEQIDGNIVYVWTQDYQIRMVNI